MEDGLEIYLIFGMLPPFSDIWAPSLSVATFLGGELWMDTLDRAPSLEEPFESVVHASGKDDGLCLV